MILFSVLFLTRSLSATKVLVPRKTADIELLFWDPPFASFPRWPPPPPPPLGLSSLFREGGRFGKLRVSGTKNPNKKGADGRRQRMQIRPPPPPPPPPPPQSPQPQQQQFVIVAAVRVSQLLLLRPQKFRRICFSSLANLAILPPSNWCSSTRVDSREAQIRLLKCQGREGKGNGATRHLPIC